MNLTNVQLGSNTAPGSPFTTNRYIDAGAFKLTLTGTGVSAIETNGAGIILVNGRLQTSKGADITAANDLTTGLDGNVFIVTGNTQINAITNTNWQSGPFIILETTGTPLFKHNTAGGAGTLPMKLAGSVDYQAAADDAILLYNNGSFWHELGRKQALGTITANSGLTMSTPTNVQLGHPTSGPSFSPFLMNRFINVAAFTLQITGTSEAFKVVTNTVGNAVQITNSGNGNGLFAITNAGIALLGQSTYASTNAVEEVLRLNRFSSGGAGASGIGSKIVFNNETSTSASRNSSYIASTWTNATDASRSASHRTFVTSETAIIERQSIFGNYTALTESTATAFLRVNVPNDQVSGGEILITVEANDATEFQSRTLRFIWTAANKAGTTAVTISTPEEVAAVSSGTLTVTITAVDAGSGNVDFKADAASSLTQTVLRCNYQLFKNFGTGVVTSN